MIYRRCDHGKLPQDKMEYDSSACTQFRGMHLIEGAGHWVQQERPAAVSQLLVEFLECETSSWRGPPGSRKHDR